MGNKRFDFYCAYIDPDEQATKTPAKRLYSVTGPFPATTASRAMTMFWKEMGEDYGWGKKDVVLIGVQPGGLTPDMKKQYEEDEVDETDDGEIAERLTDDGDVDYSSDEDLVEEEIEEDDDDEDDLEFEDEIEDED